MGAVEASERAGARLPADRERWLGVGHVSCQGLPSREAGRRATSEALAGRDARLIIAFCSDDHDLAELAAGIGELGGDTPLIGCTTAGEISSRGAGDGGVVVTAIGGAGFAVETAIGRGQPGRLREAGSAAAGCMAELDPSRPERALMLLSDGVAGDQQEVIRGVHEVVGSGTPLVGGCAGDGMKMERIFQIRGDEVISGGVVAAAIGSDAPLGIGWSHGWERIGEPMLVTSGRGNRVLEIDDRPALDAYLDRLGAPAEVRADGRAFSSWARTHPLGLGERRNGHEPVRCVSGADFGERALVCTAEVPPGGLAWFMRGDADSVLRSTAAACHDAVAALGEHPPLGVVTFDCIGRRGVLGEGRIAEEVTEIRRAVADAPAAGLYTYGEIARLQGVNALHSQTFVALAIA